MIYCIQRHSPKGIVFISDMFITKFSILLHLHLLLRIKPVEVAVVVVAAVAV